MEPGFGIAALTRHLGHAPAWSDVVVGFDFGFLTRGEIQAWSRSLEPDPETQPARHALTTVDPELESFQNHLWTACTEAEGSVSRPGHRRWLRSQDRWRLALIRETLEGDLTLRALAEALERIYDACWCPDDMLHLWRRRAPWERTPRVQNVDLPALADFLDRCGKSSAA